MRRELLFAEADRCDAEHLAESERLLRARPYLRNARLTTTPAPGGTDVNVETKDDWALRVAVRIEPGGDRGPLKSFRVIDENLFGLGLHGQVRYNNLGRKPGADLDLLYHQFLGHHQAEFLFGNSSVGWVASETVLRPFESEFDRRAWRESLRYLKEPFPLVSPALGTVVQPAVSQGADVGAALRFGEPGRLTILGAVLSWERRYVEGTPLAPRPEDDSLAAVSLSGRYTERRRIRVHVLIGTRNLRFTRRSGLDAVNAPEDVREGVETGLVLGKSLGGGGGLQHDVFTAAEIFYGSALGGGMLVFARGKAEGRYLTDQREWDNVIAAGDLLLYDPVGDRGTVVLGLSGATGSNTSVPFQLQLAGTNGIRGYGLSGLPVARRVVVQGEHRYFVGTAFGTVDVGTAAFVDLGRGWAGDAPFGENTGLKAAVGGGLRLAIPSGSRVAYRLDVAVPLSGGSGVELRLGLRQAFGFQRGEPEDVTRSREQVSSVTVFNFPRF